MAKLYDYVLEVMAKPCEAFCSAHPSGFLLLRVQASASGERSWTFDTQTISTSGAELARLMSKEGIRLSPELSDFHVFAIEKSMNNPWPERVSVGRARNNDIVLADSSVSKLHAYLVREAGVTYVCDAASRNGTRLNDLVLTDVERHQVNPGDVITFGGASVVYVDARGLFELVTRGIEPKR